MHLIDLFEDSKFSFECLVEVEVNCSDIKLRALNSGKLLSAVVHYFKFQILQILPKVRSLSTVGSSPLWCIYCLSGVTTADLNCLLKVA